MNDAAQWKAKNVDGPNGWMTQWGEKLEMLRDLVDERLNEVKS